MKRITYEMLMAWEPCYEKARLEQYRDTVCTAVEVLRMDRIPYSDRLWVVLREELLSAKDLRLFAVWCVRRALLRLSKPEPLLVACVDTAERYALGTATFEEMQAAWGAARQAARQAARDASWYASWSAARYAARYAAQNAAGDVARDAEQQAQIEELTMVFERSGL